MPEEIKRSADALVENVAADTALQAAVKADPVNAIKQAAYDAKKEVPAGALPDTWIYRIVVGALGAVVLSAVLGSVALACHQRPTPEVLTALGSAAIGALAGLLAPPPRA